jgi:hypothetical protein
MERERLHAPHAAAKKKAHKERDKESAKGVTTDGKCDRQ